jgi:hypothetical protein
VTFAARHPLARYVTAAVVDACASQRITSSGLSIKSVECARTLLHSSSQATTWYVG